MTEQLALFDYEVLAPNVRAEVEVRTLAIRGRLRSAAEDIVAIGGELVAVKAALGHGRFGDWLSAEFHWTDRVARRLMAVHERFKSDNLSDLAFGPSALYALAAPSVPDEARAEAIERAEAGETITHKVAQKIVSEHKPPVDPEPEQEPGDAEPEMWECEVCLDLFPEQVWHCKRCDHHWLVALTDHCKNCQSEVDEPVSGLSFPTDREVGDPPLFVLPELEEPSREERSYHAVSRLRLVVQLDAADVAAAGAAIHPNETMHGFDAFAVWFDDFRQALRDRLQAPIRSIK